MSRILAVARPSERKSLPLGALDPKPIIDQPTLTRLVGPHVLGIQIKQASDSQVRQLVLDWIFADPKRELMCALLAKLDFGTRLHRSPELLTAQAFHRVSVLAAQARHLANDQSVARNIVQLTSARLKRLGSRPVPAYAGELSLAELVGDSVTPIEVATMKPAERQAIVAHHINSLPDHPLRREILQRVEASSVDNAAADRLAIRTVAQAAESARQLAAQELGLLAA